MNYPDIEYPGGVALSGRLVRARKDHVCVACRTTIKAGDIYWRGFWIVDRQPVVEKRCTPCIVAEEQI